VIDLTFTHSLPPQEVARRIQRTCVRHDIAHAGAEDGLSGELSKKVAMLGSVRASYRVDPGTLRVQVLEAPPLMPEATLRRLLSEELESALAAPGD
jgi:hypothetical protein